MYQLGAVTFDGLVFNYIREQFEAVGNGCENLVVHDCSSAGLFAVLGGGMPSGWRLRFLLPGYEIEYAWMGELIVRLNGEVKTVEPSRPILIREEPADQRYALPVELLTFVCVEFSHLFYSIIIIIIIIIYLFIYFRQHGP